MSFFTSTREKKLWLLSFVVFDAIFISLFIGTPLFHLFRSQNIQALIFVSGMLLVGAMIILHARNSKPTTLELTVWIGIFAVYLMLFLRLGLPERTHLFEYSVLAILVHKALNERVRNGKTVRYPAWLAIGLALLIGVMDESIQYFLPDRVFDPVDILFNTLAITGAIGTHALLSWLQDRKGSA